MTLELVTPLSDAGVRGLIVNTAKRNLWKVANWYELEDLVQDGVMIWLKVRGHYYPKGVTDIKHLTSLFKTSFSRHIIDLAAEKRYGEELAISQFIGPDSDGTHEWETLLGVQQETATVAVLLHSAPAELKALWRFLTSEDGRERLRGRYQKKGGVKETTNEFLCRLLGLDPEMVNLEKIARQHFFG